MTNPIPFPTAKPNRSRSTPLPAYAELQCCTNFSFLRGASHPGELVEQAKALGHSALGIADRNSVAGVVRAHAAATKEGLKLLVGARIDLVPEGFAPKQKDGRNDKLAESDFAGAPPGFSCLLYPTDRAAWGRLCTLLSKGKMRAQKGECHLWFDDLLAALEGQIVIALPPEEGAFSSPLVGEDSETRQCAAEPSVDLGEGASVHAFASAAPSPRSTKAHCVRQVDLSSPTRGEEKNPHNPIQLHPKKPSQNNSFEHYLNKLNRTSPGNVWLAASMLYAGDDRRRLNVLNQLANRTGVPLVATNDVHYHAVERRPLQDVISCIREKCTLETAGFKLAQNAERHLKTPAEMARLFAAFPQAIAATQEIVSRCSFSLDELSYHYPNEPVPKGKTAQQHLTDLTWEGAKTFYPHGLPDEVRSTIIKELALIEKLNYAQYFLTVHDIVAWARGQKILCQGRGSAANSAVCYCLGVTAVDPSKISLLFERFLSEERKEPPDIDVDFEHERREEVIQYIYRRYGRHRAAIAATIITYRPRSAIREVGKVMGLTEDVTTALASTVWGSWGKDIPQNQIREAGLDLADPHLARTIDLTQQLLGFPRHLSQHVGGFILTENALTETVPVGNAAMDERSFIEWDKDDIDELKIMKVDVLALGMLSCIRKCFDLIRNHYRQDFTLANLPREDVATYEMLQRGDSLGTFQVESRAQMNMLPRLKPARFYDLVIQVAIVRPGPIQGDMVHPYLRRRDGLETVDYPRPAPPADPNELKNILGRTLGVPLFQEQAMQIAIDAAKFTPGEANLLRKAMATFRRAGTIHTLQEKMVGRMIARGYDAEFAERCFNQIKGFGEYGFPESHAASFALLVYVSSFIKCHYPDAFCAGLLNAQPMGFYAPAQIVRDAKEHGIAVRPIDVSFSDWDNTLEENFDGSFAVRLGFRQADGLREEVMRRFVAVRGKVGQDDQDTIAAIVAPSPRSAKAHFVRQADLSSPTRGEENGEWRGFCEDDGADEQHTEAEEVSPTEDKNSSPLPSWERIARPGDAQQSRRSTLVRGQQCLPSQRLQHPHQQPPTALQPHRGVVLSSPARGEEKTLPFTTIDQLHNHLTVATLERLAANDAFRSLGLDRREGLWAVRGLMSDGQLPLFAAVDEKPVGEDVPVILPAMRDSEHVVADYQTHKLSLKAHPLSFLRETYQAQGMIEANDLWDMKQKQRCAIAGVVLVRQRPGTAKGVVFMTIEDETGVANIVIWKKVMEKHRKVVMGARLVKIIGEVQRTKDVIHVVAHRLEDLTSDLDQLSEDELPEVVARADHVRSPLNSRKTPQQRPDFLANADEVRRGSQGEEYLRMSRAEREAKDKSALGPLAQEAGKQAVPKPVLPRQKRIETIPARGTHPRNVRVIPKSRDFH